MSPLLTERHLQIIVREAKRQNAAYRKHSVRCLGRICRARRDIDMSGVVFEIVEPILAEGAEGERMDVDSGKPSVEADDEA